MRRLGLPDDNLDIVIDTDFLSSFLKIGRVGLVKDFFNVDCVSIPLAVFTEIGKTGLVDKLIETDWIKIRTVKNRNYADLNSKDFDALGAGEQECMMLCKDSQKHILLINDKKARQIATSSGISILNISAFLLACKRSNYLDNSEISKIINDLKENDYFEFSKNDQDNLNL
jgi:predicted nucleic acid-binding protein